MIQWQAAEGAMTSKLQNIVERIEQLPEPVQSDLADRIEEMLTEVEDQAWENAFADPVSDAFFASARAEIEQAENDGTLTPLFPQMDRYANV